MKCSVWAHGQYFKAKKKTNFNIHSNFSKFCLVIVWKWNSKNNEHTVQVLFCFTYKDEQRECSVFRFCHFCHLYLFSNIFFDRFENLFVWLSTKIEQINPIAWIVYNVALFAKVQKYLPCTQNATWWLKFNWIIFYYIFMTIIWTLHFQLHLLACVRYTILKGGPH